MTQERDTAKKIVEYLDEGTSALDSATVAQLAAARRQAVAAMPVPASVASARMAHAGLGDFVVQHFHGRHAWMSMLAVLAIMLMVFAAIQKNYTQNPVEADALLLASDLPPEAYVDKGFDAWLQNSSQL